MTTDPVDADRVARAEGRMTRYEDEKEEAKGRRAMEDKEATGTKAEAIAIESMAARSDPASAAERDAVRSEHVHEAEAVEEGEAELARALG